MKTLDKFSTKRKIPRGPYCYKDKGKHLCPYYKYKLDSDVLIAFCEYLKCGDISSISEDDFNKLLASRDSNLRYLYEQFPLDLLWDQVKECGVKL